MASAIETLVAAGAKIVCGGNVGGGAGYSYANTVLEVSGDTFLERPDTLQTEAFGNATLLVRFANGEQAAELIKQMEGNLTGCFYTANDGSDDGMYDDLAPHLRQKVGRLLNDKMPTYVNRGM